MDLTMGIAAMAMSMQQAQLQSAVSTEVLSKTMDAQSSQAAALIQDFTQNSPTAPFGSVGHFFDARG